MKGSDFENTNTNNKSKKSLNAYSLAGIGIWGDSWFRILSWVWYSYKAGRFFSNFSIYFLRINYVTSIGSYD